MRSSNTSRAPNGSCENFLVWPLLSESWKDHRSRRKCGGQRRRIRPGRNWRVITVAKDDRDILELLKDELDFIAAALGGSSTHWDNLKRSLAVEFSPLSFE